MKFNPIQTITDRHGKPMGVTNEEPNGQTLGGALVAIIDASAFGHTRHLHNVADRIEAAADAHLTFVEINEKEDAALKDLLGKADGLASFYLRRIRAMLWPAEMDDTERKAMGVTAIHAAMGGVKPAN